MSVHTGGADTPRVRVTIDDAGLGRLTLAWPERRNAIDRAMAIALRTATEELKLARGLRAILVEGEGSTFTVGGDLAHIAAVDDIGEELRLMIADYHVALNTLGTIAVPVVAAVRGACAGGGLGIALPADILLAAEGTKFATGFHLLGLSGDGGTSWWIPRLVGLRRAKEMIIGGRVLDAVEAADWGLITRVVPDAELDAEALSIATGWTTGPTRGLGTMRKMLARTWDATLADQLHAEFEVMGELGGTADARTGIDAFVARQKPRFEGR